MKDKQATKISFKSLLIIIVLIVAVVLIAKFAFFNKPVEKGTNEKTPAKQTETVAETTPEEKDYYGMKATEEEIKSNKQKDEQIQELAQELIMTSDMISYDYGMEQYDKTEQKNETEEEKEQTKLMASERYYRERDEIKAKLKELLK